MEALGNCVIASEAPHGSNLLAPGGESIAELHELWQAGMLKLINGLQEPGRQWNALFARAVFLQQQITEPLFESIDFAQNWELDKISLQSRVLILAEIVAMTAHQRKQPTMFGSERIDLPPRG